MNGVTETTDAKALTRERVSRRASLAEPKSPVYARLPRSRTLPARRKRTLSGGEWLDLHKHNLRRKTHYLAKKPVLTAVSRTLQIIPPAPAPYAHNADPKKSGAMPCAILTLETKYNDGSAETAAYDSQTQTT